MDILKESSGKLKDGSDNLKETLERFDKMKLCYLYDYEDSEKVYRIRFPFFSYENRTYNEKYWDTNKHNNFSLGIIVYVCSDAIHFERKAHLTYEIKTTDNVPKYHDAYKIITLGGCPDVDGTKHQDTYYPYSVDTSAYTTEYHSFVKLLHGLREFVGKYNDFSQ